jgi:hypothetical protein
MNYFLRRLMTPGKLRKVFVERLTEPIHLNVLSLLSRYLDHIVQG